MTDTAHPIKDRAGRTMLDVRARDGTIRTHIRAFVRERGDDFRRNGPADMRHLTHRVGPIGDGCEVWLGDALEDGAGGRWLVGAMTKVGDGRIAWCREDAE